MNKSSSSMRTSAGVIDLLRSPVMALALFFLTLALAWDWSGLDLHVMRWFGNSNGFLYKNNYWLSVWLNDRGQQFSVLVFLSVVLMVWLPLGPWRRLGKRQRLVSVVAAVVSLLTIATIKRYSLTSCPWDLNIFGGSAFYVSHWQLGTHDGGAGKCFPGGHASSALGLMALCIPFLLSESRNNYRFGLFLIVLLISTGILFGGVQTVRGAHYPSHTLWTALICWVSGLLAYFSLNPGEFQRSTRA